MIHIIKRDNNKIPKDPAEFENAVISTIHEMVKDGSVYASHHDIFYYNKWVYSGNISRKIGDVFRNKLNMEKISPRCYKIPEELRADINEVNT